MPGSTIQALTDLPVPSNNDVLPIVHDPSGTPVDRSITFANLRKSMISMSSIPFTDGDTYRRVTITDSSVLSTSNIVCTVRRPDSASDSLDYGYIYTVNIYRVGTGSFDVGILCTGWGNDDVSLLPPNETVSLCYMIG